MDAAIVDGRSVAALAQDHAAADRVPELHRHRPAGGRVERRLAPHAVDLRPNPGVAGDPAGGDHRREPGDQLQRRAHHRRRRHRPVLPAGQPDRPARSRRDQPHAELGRPGGGGAAAGHGPLEHQRRRQHLRRPSLPHQPHELASRRLRRRLDPGAAAHHPDRDRAGPPLAVGLPDPGRLPARHHPALRRHPRALALDGGSGPRSGSEAARSPLPGQPEAGPGMARRRPCSSRTPASSSAPGSSPTTSSSRAEASTRGSRACGSACSGRPSPLEGCCSGRSSTASAPSRCCAGAPRAP